jgi:hypothetical protein
MANRFPLIIDTSDDNKLKELPSGDNIDLTGSGIVNSNDISSNTKITSLGEVVGQTLKCAGITEAQRDSLSPENGSIVYNTDRHKFQGYANGVWVDLH